MATTQGNTATTDETVTAHLKASLLKMDLEQHGIAEHRQAERTAMLCVNLHDATMYDAALWKGAEALYAFMDGRHEALPLSKRDASVRALYLTMAVQCWSRVRLALEGGFPAERMAEAYADYSNHVAQLSARAARSSFAVVDGGK